MSKRPLKKTNLYLSNFFMEDTKKAKNINKMIFLMSLENEEKKGSLIDGKFDDIKIPLPQNDWSAILNFSQNGLGSVFIFDEDEFQN